MTRLISFIPYNTENNYNIHNVLSSLSFHSVRSHLHLINNVRKIIMILNKLLAAGRVNFVNSIHPIFCILINV